MLSSLCWLFLLSILGPQTHEDMGTKIVTRHISPGGVSEETLYIKADRRRVEFRRPLQRTDNDGATGTQSVPSSIFILRCDLTQSFLLRPTARAFSSSPYPPNSPGPEQATRLAEQNSDSPEPVKPTLRIETTTLDTGERKEMFGYAARHVITTMKQTPLDGTTAQSSESVTDGWYIDLDRSISCDPKPSPGGKRSGFVTSAGAGKQSHAATSRRGNRLVFVNFSFRGSISRFALSDRKMKTADAPVVEERTASFISSTRSQSSPPSAPRKTCEKQIRKELQRLLSPENFCVGAERIGLVESECIA